MKKTVALIAMVLAIGMTAALDAEAKRLGGGKSAGMQRQSTTAPATPAGAGPHAPAQGAPAAASPAATGAAATAAAAPKRSWMGPIAGLAAGLGLAALASHLGFGEALANMMMIGLLVMGVLLVIGFILRKRAQGRPALAGAGGAFGQEAQHSMYRSAEMPSRTAEAPSRTAEAPSATQGGSLIGSRLGDFIGSQRAVSQSTGIPADFDVQSFARNAEAQFMALQAANDAGDMQRLREYLTPELLDLVRADIDARGGVPQNTQVFGLQAQVLDVAQEEAQYVVSVRFTGSVRDQHGAVPETLDEVWHLAKSRTGQAGWLVAGIQQGGEVPVAPSS